MQAMISSNNLMGYILDYCDDASVVEFSRTCRSSATRVWRQRVSACFPEVAHLDLPPAIWKQIYRTQVEQGQALFSGVFRSQELTPLPRRMRKAKIIKASYPWILFKHEAGISIYKQGSQAQLTPLEHVVLPEGSYIDEHDSHIVDDHLLCLATHALRVFDLASGRLRYTLDCPELGFWSHSRCIVLLDSHRCATHCNDTTINIYDWKAGTLGESLTSPLKRIQALTVRHLMTGPELVIAGCGVNDLGAVVLTPIDGTPPRFLPKATLRASCLRKIQIALSCTTVQPGRD